MKRLIYEIQKAVPKLLVIPVFVLMVATFENCSNTHLVRPIAPLASVPPATIGKIKPVLAIRGVACLLCHAQIHNSSVVTDFGYGDPFFMGANVGSGNSVYRDNGSQGWASNISVDGKVIVPDASVYTSLIPNQRIVDYIKSITSGTVTGGFETRKFIYIAAPTETMIRQVIALPTTERLGGSGTVSIYRPNGFGQVTGLIAKVNEINGSWYVTNDPAGIKCSGDIIVDGTLYLNSVTYMTSGGCRIYVTGSIFVQGSITATPDSINPNLQLSSSKMIAMGMRSLTVRFSNDEFTTGLRGAKTHSDEINSYQALYDDRDKIDNTLVDDSGPFRIIYYQYKTASGVIQPSYIGLYSADDDNDQFLPAPGAVQPPSGKQPSCNLTPVANDPSNIADSSTPNDSWVCMAKWAENKLGMRKTINYAHVALNAPLVHSRYFGEFKGVVIAEKALFAVGELNFIYDDVFSTVDLFPLFGTQILNVSDQ